MKRAASRLTRTKKKPYTGPFPQNKNLLYQTIRQNMEMPADGPTLNEVSPMDTTQSFTDIEDQQPRNVGGRPVKTSVAVQNWFSDNIKTIIISVVSTIFGTIFILIAINHSEKIISNEKDIEHMEESISIHDRKLDGLQEKANELNTDLRLLEQKVDLTKESSKQGKK